uniref:Uncharacterized protein n=1 Tax=Anguilla anguilla TaxID=7936 RepID=A0A0E9VL56_ANGAN
MAMVIYLEMRTGKTKNVFR